MQFYFGGNKNIETITRNDTVYCMYNKSSSETDRQNTLYLVKIATYLVKN